MKNNKQIIYLILVIAVIFVVVGISTYAYFNSSDGVNMEAPLNVATANSVFTASSEGDIVLNITYDKMTQANISTNTIDNDNAIVTVTLDNEGEKDVISCTYDLVWVWDSKDKYTESDVPLAYEKDGVSYPYELSTKVDKDEEKDLSSFTWTEAGGKTEGIIASKEIIVNGKGSITNTHNVEVKVYNIPVDQKNLFNKNFQAHIEVKNNRCKAESITMAKYITNIAYTEEGASGLYYHDGVGTYTNANLEAGDNSYRYSGTDPDNYLCFKEGCSDDEKYRIIGVIDNKVKVIKMTMTSGGDRAWGYNNTWTGSLMETYLNGEYLTSLGDNANLIDTTTWHVGGFPDAKMVSENVKEIYNLESNSTPTTERKIGLIYANEYMYAAEPTYWNLVGFDYFDHTKDYSTSKGKDWMVLPSHAWTISRTSDYSANAFAVSPDGFVSRFEPVDHGLAVRPTFSFLPSIKYVSGTGTSEKPYIVR